MMPQLLWCHLPVHEPHVFCCEVPPPPGPLDRLPLRNLMKVLASFITIVWNTEPCAHSPQFRSIVSKSEAGQLPLLIVSLPGNSPKWSPPLNGNPPQQTHNLESLRQVWRPEPPQLLSLPSLLRGASGRLPFPDTSMEPLSRLQASPGQL